MDIFNYNRRVSSVTNIGGVLLGGDNPIRIQSMTDTSTRDIEASVNQVLDIADAGADYVRLTTQGVLEVDALAVIRTSLREKGNTTPLIADIHFNPNVADAAAKITDKIRINPGNFTDSARVFKIIEYSDESYQEEINRLEKRFIQLLDICKEHNTALRIGVNHGSLSDRIMSRYGDTPEGIAESCMEFLRVCKRVNFNNVVLSIKASNTVVMVKSVKLLIEAMERENMNYPLHLGVTEAGDGEDGRIKSAVGIGALLCDGIGDTIRVSLSEPPRNEVPVASALVDYIREREGHARIEASSYKGYSYLNMERRPSFAIGNIGGDNSPIVISNGACTLSGTLKPDYFFDGNVCTGDNGEIAVIGIEDIETYKSLNETIFLRLSYPQLTNSVIEFISNNKNIAVLAYSNHINQVGELRAIAHTLTRKGCNNPVVLMMQYNESDKDLLQIKCGADLGALLLDGVGNGVFICNSGAIDNDTVVSIAFSALQAARLRTTKTEYISCPGCGRTQFDLQKTVARIKEATAHLVGLKIGIMGCIVNGPGEMADADYGYVGAARGKISLYKGKECIEKNIPEDEAVERLLKFIEEDRSL
jgi:(E)-4-hydroxy-3-methylbut-2-enyl-diphosphate synthase